MRTTRIAPAVALLLLAGLVTFANNEMTPIEQLGNEIFEDENLSINHNQSCATCHMQAWGGTGPDEAINAGGGVYEGSIPGRFGDRKPPSSIYSPMSPIFYYMKQSGGLWVGGNFWDGRATGERLGNPAADQAQGPFLNPAEQALPDAACVVYLVANSDYADLYQQVWGDEIVTINFPTNTSNLCENEDATVPLSAEDRARVNMEYDNIALAIAAYEAAPAVSQFSSKFDAWRGGGVSFTKTEQKGFALFQGKGKCARCHVSSGKLPLFTDFTYDNLGTPPNPENPAVMTDPSFRDRGLGAFLENRGETAEVYEAEDGKVKVPTLRNVDQRPSPDSIKAFSHNGYFKTLKGLVHFYNTRDVKDVCPDPLTTEAAALAMDCWPPPEIPRNLNTSELGDLGLSGAEEDAIVAFLKTLSDGFALPEAQTD